MVAKITVLKARTGAGGTYRAVTDEHDVTYLCYDKTLWHYLEPGKFFYAEYDVTAKKDGTGSYNRIISISTEEPKAQAEPTLKAEKPAESPTPEQAVRDAAREAAAEVVGAQKTPTPIGDAKNRAFALSYLKDIIVALINAGVIKQMTPELYDEILKRAQKWAEWLDGKTTESNSRTQI